MLAPPGIVLCVATVVVDIVVFTILEVTFCANASYFW
jgi:hypothetical protein